MSQAYDFVIVGSGAGGGMVAQRLAPLAKAGAKIALLEAGPHYPPAYFTQREIEMMGLFWFGGGWPTANGAITLAAGKALGGSTLMYTGVTFRLPDEVCRKWNVPGLNPADLAPRFDSLEKDLSVSEPGPDMVNDNNRLFADACQKLGWPLEKLKLNLKNCEQMGFCNIGCSTGAKQGTLEVQIPRAREAGVEIVPNCTVNRILDKKLQLTVSTCPSGTMPGPWETGEQTIEAKTVILAAGSPGTTGILLRSNFGERLPALGLGLTLHPAVTLYGIYPEPIKNYRGFPKTYFTPQFTKSHDFYMETAFYYPFISTKHMGIWGADLKQAMRAYDRFMTVIILNHDKALDSNRIVLDRKGEMVMQYEISKKTRKSLVRSQIEACRLFYAAGCEQVIMPCGDRPMFSPNEVPEAALEDFITEKNFIENKMPISSAHPQGGCRMGTNEKDSVTDAWGKVHGTDWLYVADASLFPQSSHVNPYLTVMALADRVGEKLAEK